MGGVRSESSRIWRSPEIAKVQIRLAQALDLPFLLLIPRGFIFLALAAWLAAFVGLVRMLVSNVPLHRALRGIEEKAVRQEKTPDEEQLRTRSARTR
jgi:hypothetical protein